MEKRCVYNFTRKYYNNQIQIAKYKFYRTVMSYATKLDEKKLIVTQNANIWGLTLDNVVILNFIN